jgi:colanic acid biosynthesis glycosyl transferase WcaI
VQDLEVDAAVALGKVRSKWLRIMSEALERSMIRHADLVVTISRKMLKALIARGAQRERATILRNWVDLSSITPEPPSAPNEFREALGLVGKRVALYSGHMGEKQGLDVLIECAKICTSKENLQFVICGEGPCKAALVERARTLGNVTFLPLQPLAKLNALLNLADIHLLPQVKEANDLVLPSKLASMLASGRPVIATATDDSEIGDLLKRAGILIPPGNAEALAQALMFFAETEWAQMAKQARMEARHFNAQHLLPEFEQLLVSLSASRFAKSAGINIEQDKA